MSTSVALKVTQIGNSVGVILPKEVLARLKVQKGDSLYVTDLADGVALRAYDAEFAEAMGLAREIMRKRRNLSLIHISEPTRPY